jgi:hypothetical protein
MCGKELGDEARKLRVDNLEASEHGLFTHALRLRVAGNRDRQHGPCRKHSIRIERRNGRRRVVGNHPS